MTSSKTGELAIKTILDLGYMKPFLLVLLQGMFAKQKVININSSQIYHAKIGLDSLANTPINPGAKTTESPRDLFDIDFSKMPGDLIKKLKTGKPLDPTEIRILESLGVKL